LKNCYRLNLHFSEAYNHQEKKLESEDLRFIYFGASIWSKRYSKPNSGGVKPKKYVADVELSAKNWTRNSLIT